MKLSIKLFIIVLVGTIVTFLINFSVKENKMSIVALGDGVSLGLTYADIVGVSYNDYLKEMYENKDDLQSFNNEFSMQHLTIDELVEALEKNMMGEKSKVPLKQILAKADIITIGIGMDELTNLSMKNRLNEKTIEKYLSDFRRFLKNIRLFYDKDILVVGLYSAYDFDKGMVVDVNFQLQSIVGEYKGKFLDISAIALNPEYYSNNVSYYMNYKGHKAIFEMMKKMLV